MGTTKNQISHPHIVGGQKKEVVLGVQAPKP